MAATAKRTSAAKAAPPKRTAKAGPAKKGPAKKSAEPGTGGRPPSSSRTVRPKPAKRGADPAPQSEAPVWKRPLPHVKLAFALLIWVSLLVPQARLVADVRLFAAQAMIAVGAVPLCTLAVVYLYPPRTPRWRTLVWVMVASTVAGAVGREVFGGRGGIFTLLVVGGLVLACRANGNARALVRRIRDRRLGGRAA